MRGGRVEVAVTLDRPSQVAFQKQMSLIRKANQMAVARGLYKEAHIIIGEAKLTPKNVPYKHGPLQSSGTVANPVLRENGAVRQVLGFGGPAAPYAKRQHEDLTLRHHPPFGKGGRAKYLEIPAMERASYIGKTVADELVKGFREVGKARVKS